MKLHALLLLLPGIAATHSLAQMHPAGAATVSKPTAPSAQPGGPGKPVYSSPVVTRETSGHAVSIDADLTGARKLYLVVTDGGNGFATDWSDWVEPRLHGDYGERKLTGLKWVRAASDWGSVNLNKNAAGQPLVVNGQPVAEGIGTHASSVIEYDLPPGTRRFRAKGALDKGGVDQGQEPSVVFQVWTTKPVVAPSGGGHGGGPKDPVSALHALDVADGLDAATYAAEPLLQSPSSIDVDARGRVWVAEVVNYRGHNGKRPEGDRILILEDGNGDGKAEKQTVFYQAPDFRSPHGVCVLGNVCLVSVGDKVLKLTDENRDDKADRVEAVFTGISGTQHDHGIHAFHFGPDGKLYFNFGNEGRELRDGSGKPITDAFGNVINNSRKPYQEGMIFRCDPDFTNLETLAWNFRNNWECCVDSFGNVWQSDNDDDGNRGVRINFVLEFGNYGYRDEMTGDSWQKGDAKTEEEVQAAHWHLHDPGVVPNLLHTGAGSPTGIICYEGTLLPAAWQNRMIHCDAGPNAVRAYPVETSGAGYRASISNLLLGVRDRWFRPSDVCAAPDGSLFVADWYDPGVGGHAMGDLDHGRIYRVAPPQALAKYPASTPDFSTAEGAVTALCSPNEATRYLAWKALENSKDQALPALEKLWQSGAKPHLRARALWALGKFAPACQPWVSAALKETNPDLRITGLRLARQQKADLLPILAGLINDPSEVVRREALIALRHIKGSESARLWAQFARQHDGQDKWYLAALGIGAALHWDECFDAWLAAVGEQWDTPAGRDVIWISRAAKTGGFLAKILTNPAVATADKFRFVRAFDFLPPSEAKQATLREILSK